MIDTFEFERLWIPDTLESNFVTGPIVLFFMIYILVKIDGALFYDMDDGEDKSTSELNDLDLIGLN